MKVIEKRTGKIIEVEPYYLDGRIVAYRGYSDLPGFEHTRQAFLPDELSRLPDPEPTDELETAANNWGKDMYCSCLKPYNETGLCDGCSLLPEAFKDGAKWAFSQGETYEVRTMKNGLSGYTIVLHTVESFEPDEEVIIQVRKKNKKEEH